MAVTWERIAFISDDAYGAGWNGVAGISPSQNAVYDEMELRTKASAVITDNKLIRGDGGSRGVQESTIIVDDSGRMINPSQPCFQVKPGSSQLNIALGSAVTVVLGTEVFDIGNNFTANTFTAPVTGKYLFTVTLSLENVDSAASYYQLFLITSNRTLTSLFSSNSFSGDLSYFVLQCAVVTDMDVNDTAYIAIYQSGGAVQTDIAKRSFFSGALFC